MSARRFAATGKARRESPTYWCTGEGTLYKVTLFRRSGVRRRLKPETYLLEREENGNLYMNTGFRIDVAYNEETDVLTFSPNGDYIRVDTDDTSDGEKKEEQ